MGTSEVQAVFDLLYAFRDNSPGSRECTCRRAWTSSTRTGRRRRRRL